MTFIEVRVYSGVRFAQDNYGAIWRELTNAPPGAPHWVRLDVRSFDLLVTLTSFRLATS